MTERSRARANFSLLLRPLSLIQFEKVANFIWASHTHSHTLPPLSPLSPPLTSLSTSLLGSISLLELQKTFFSHYFEEHKKFSLLATVSDDQWSKGPRGWKRDSLLSMGSISIGKLLRHWMVSKSLVCVKFKHPSAILKIWQAVAVVVPASPSFLTATEKGSCSDLHQEPV